MASWYTHMKPQTSGYFSLAHFSPEFIIAACCACLSLIVKLTDYAIILRITSTDLVTQWCTWKRKADPSQMASCGFFVVNLFFPDYHDNNMLFLAHKLPSFICLPCLQSQDIVSIKITSLCQIFVKKSLSSLVCGPVFVVNERLSPANENSYSSMSKSWSCLRLTSWK